MSDGVDAVAPAGERQTISCQRFRACVLKAGRVERAAAPSTCAALELGSAVVRRERPDEEQEDNPCGEDEAVHQEWAATCTLRFHCAEVRARLRVRLPPGAHVLMFMRVEGEGSRKFRL